MSDRLQPTKLRGGRNAGPGGVGLNGVGGVSTPIVSTDGSGVGAAVPPPRFVGSPRVVGFSPSVGGAPDPFALTHPALWEYLTLDEAHGQRRQTATLTLFAEDGRFKACLSDRETDTVGFVAGESIQGLLDALEQVLQGGRMDWRASKRGRK